MARSNEPGSREPSPDGLGPSGFDPSRREDVRKALFRSYAVKAAAERAERASLAAGWFADYGRSTVGKDAATVRVHLHYASACVGSKEAQAYMDDAALAMLPEIVAEARRMAEAHMQGLLDLLPASAIEARSDATGTGAAEGESADPKGDAQS